MCARGNQQQIRSEEHTSELQSRLHLVCRLLLEKNKKGRSTRRRAKSARRASDTCPGDVGRPRSPSAPPSTRRCPPTRQTSAWHLEDEIPGRRRSTEAASRRPGWRESARSPLLRTPLVLAGRTTRWTRR